jgi:hypothetical protein
MVGVRYQQDSSQREDIMSYHENGTTLRDLREEGHAIDRLSVPVVDRNFIPTLGFEVEKTNISDRDRSSTIWWKHERDASCGHESVTHAIPALRAGLWREKILSLINDAADVLDAEVSSDCGGHVTMSCPGTSREQCYGRLRPYIHMVYAIWPERLNNTFCADNPELDATKMARKYSTVKYRGVQCPGHSLVELRVPGAVKNTSDMVARYKFFTQFAYWVEQRTPVAECHRWMKRNYEEVIVPMVTDPAVWANIRPDKWVEKFIIPCRDGVQWLSTGRQGACPEGWETIESGDISQILISIAADEITHGSVSVLVADEISSLVGDLSAASMMP